MSSSYNFIDHTADIAVDVTADSIDELFAASAFAFKEAVIENSSRKENEKFNLQLNSYSAESLLVNFLNELNFRLTSGQKIINNIVSIKVKQDVDEWNLEAELSEYIVDEDKIKTEIKSVTYHQMEIKEDKGKYSTRIVFDI